MCIRDRANRASWNEAAERYREEIEETIRFLREGRSNLHPIERRNLGELRRWCRRAIHLQCASGRDTLSLVNEGVAEVAGVDISDLHIENARRTSEALGIPARWFRCDVLETPHELDGWADLVYTGRGAVCWMHDLDAWAAVAYRLLRKGGVFHVFDGHPSTYLFDFDASEVRWSGLHYFRYCEVSRGWSPGYLGNLGKPVEEEAPKYERLWTIADVFMALRGAGFDVERIGEHPDPYFNAFPNLSADACARLPMTFSVLARRPR
ncbi:MAG: class I SAM-dependent methyltransferase [Candidatus Eisenbacteria bacterium]|nr:class I SAM-dependent methyltransferase [Candidatus Eisenbacteria bacterium]